MDAANLQSNPGAAYQQPPVTQVFAEDTRGGFVMVTDPRVLLRGKRVAPKKDISDDSPKWFSEDPATYDLFMFNFMAFVTHLVGLLTAFSAGLSVFLAMMLFLSEIQPIAMFLDLGSATEKLFLLLGMLGVTLSALPTTRIHEYSSRGGSKSAPAVKLAYVFNIHVLLHLVCVGCSLAATALYEQAVFLQLPAAEGLTTKLKIATSVRGAVYVLAWLVTWKGHTISKELPSTHLQSSQPAAK